MQLVQVLLGCCWLMLFAGSAPAQEWNRFRGPNGAGTSSVTIPAAWDEDDYRWRVAVPGIGHASPVVWEDRIFVSSGDEETGARLLVCLDRATGEEVWSRSFDDATHAKHNLNSFASTTPVVDERGEHLAWGTPEHIWVVAVTHDGDEAWRTDLGPYRSGHGFGQSLITYGDLLILPVEHQGESFRAALNTSDGAVRWRVPSASSLHYATPCVRTRADGVDELIFVNWEQGIAAVDPLSGEVNWSADVFDKSHIESSIGSPVLAGGLVIGVAGWLGHGYEAIAVDPDADGAPVVWKLDRGAPLCTTPLVLGESVYFWSDQDRYVRGYRHGGGPLARAGRRGVLLVAGGGGRAHRQRLDRGGGGRPRRRARVSAAVPQQRRRREPCHSGAGRRRPVPAHVHRTAVPARHDGRSAARPGFFAMKSSQLIAVSGGRR